MEYITKVHAKLYQSEAFSIQYVKVKEFYVYKDYKIITATKLNVISTNQHM